MAEAIARHWLGQGNPGEGIFVASAGTLAAEGTPVSVETLQTLSALGIEHEGRSTLLTAQMIEQAELVFCMTGSHRDAARMLVADRPEHLEKVHCLDPAGDIEDPIGQGRPAYDALAQRLMELVPQRLKETVVS